MFEKIRLLFTVAPRYAQLSRYDLNGIAISACQRGQSRGLALNSLEHQYPHLFVDATAETKLREAARATEEMASQAINTTPQLLTAAEAFQDEAPVLDLSSARESTVDVMETAATSDLVQEQAAEEASLYSEQQQRIAKLQRQIAGIPSTAPKTDQEIREAIAA